MMVICSCKALKPVLSWAYCLLSDEDEKGQRPLHSREIHQQPSSSAKAEPQEVQAAYKHAEGCVFAQGLKEPALSSQKTARALHKVETLANWWSTK